MDADGRAQRHVLGRRQIALGSLQVGGAVAVSPQQSDDDHSYYVE